MTQNKFVPPEFEKAGFTCPECGVYSNFIWEELCSRSSGMMLTGVFTANCSHCKKGTIWLEVNKRMIWPQDGAMAPLPSPDMPKEVSDDYLEARSVVASSSRGAAALLRLAIQKLCVFLGGSGANLNDDIGSLVKKGLPVSIQKALDIVRVTGNNAVHPGEMSVEDNPEIVGMLFGLINLIVENQITQPKAIDSLYKKLPKASTDAINRRDGKSGK